MMYIINKEFTFDAAHRIFKHFGKCANLHGHTYKVILYLKDDGLDDSNVVVDYYNLKSFKDYIDESFDHATLVAQDDTELLEATKTLGKRMILSATTAESLAKHFYSKASELFPDLVAKIEVKETPKTGAVYYE